MGTRQSLYIPRFNLRLSLILGWVAVSFGLHVAPDVASAEQSSSSYFGSGLGSGAKKAPSSPQPKSKLKKSEPVEEELTLDDEASPANSTPRKKVKAPANLRFNKSRATHDTNSLELDVEEPSETASTESEITADVQHRIDQAGEFEKTNRWADVVSVLKPVTASLPRTDLLLLSRAYSATRQPLDEVRVLDLSKSKYPGDFVTLTKLGAAYVKINKGAEAISNFYDAKEINPRYKPAYEGLLSELQNQGNSYEARTLAEDMISKFGDEPKYHTILCRLLTKDAFLDKAIEVCGTAASRNPQVPENFVNLALSLRDKLEAGRALSTINEAAGKFPASELVLTTQGLIYSDKKDFNGAYEAYKKATNFAVRSVKAWTGYARSAFEVHKYEESLKAFERLCRLDPHSIRDFREMAGRLHKDKDRDWEYKFTDALGKCP